MSINQTDTLWKLVALHCDIQTVASIFRTSKRHKRLSESETLWRQLSYRDFGRREDKNDYISRYLLGTHFVSLAITFGGSVLNILDTEGINLLIRTDQHLFITYRKPVNVTHPHLTLITDTFVVNNVLYMSHFGKRTIISNLDDLSKSPVDLKPLFDWLHDYFTVCYGFCFGKNTMFFQGRLKPNRHLFENDDVLGSDNESYYLTYDGQLMVDGFGIYSIHQNSSTRLYERLEF